MLLQNRIQQNVVPERIEPGPPRHLFSLIASALIGIPTTELVQCEANAAFVCYYIIRLWLLRRYNDRFFSLDLDYFQDLTASDIKLEMETIHRDLNHLCSVQHTLRLLSTTSPSKRSSLASKFRGLNTDLEHLVQKTKKAMKFGTFFLNSELAQMQIEEAEKNKATAEGVASLTIVATIYIPLNFAASFFGMNMSAFGNGTVQLSTYVGAVLFVATLTFIPFVSQFAKWARSHPGLNESMWSMSWRLARVAPIKAFWLAIFCISHSQRDIHLIGLRGLYTSQWGRVQTYPFTLPKGQFLGAFWETKMQAAIRVAHSHHPLLNGPRRTRRNQFPWEMG